MTVGQPTGPTLEARRNTNTFPGLNPSRSGDFTMSAPLQWPSAALMVLAASPMIGGALKRARQPARRRMSPSSSPLIALLLIGSVVTPQACRAGDSGAATVNGRPTVRFPATPNIPAANGVSLAGARVYHPNQEDYQVSGPKGASRAATPGETGPMRALTDKVADIVRTASNPNSGVNPIDAAATANKAFVTAAANLAPAGADFPDQPKGNGTTLTAETQRLHNDNALEEAGAAIARQHIDDGVLKPFTTAPTHTNPIQEPHTLATAYAINRDPVAVQWASEAEVQVSLGGTSFSLATSGTSGAAAAAFNLTGAYVNGTLDLNTPETSATSLFDLSAVLFGQDGHSPDASLSLDYTGNSIQDSLGNTGLNAVENAMISQLVPLGGDEYDFSPGYSITFGIPENPTESILFLNEYDASASQAAVPEPSTLTMAATAALALLSWWGWRRAGRGINRPGSERRIPGPALRG
jgi:hypothetical protein